MSNQERVHERTYKNRETFCEIVKRAWVETLWIIMDIITKCWRWKSVGVWWPRASQSPSTAGFPATHGKLSIVPSVGPIWAGVSGPLAMSSSLECFMVWRKRQLSTGVTLTPIKENGLLTDFFRQKTGPQALRQTLLTVLIQKPCMTTNLPFTCFLSSIQSSNKNSRNHFFKFYFSVFLLLFPVLGPVETLTVALCIGTENRIIVLTFGFLIW